MSVQEDNLKRAIRDGDEQKIRKEYKDLVDSLANARQKAPEPLDWYRKVYGH